MTVSLIHAIQNFIGLASDDKPENPPAGSTFHESNTGEIYIYDGADWVQDLRMINAVSQGYEF